MTITCGETAGNSSGSDVSPPWCGIFKTSTSWSRPVSSKTCCASPLGVAGEQHRIVARRRRSSTTESLFGSECEPSQQRSGDSTSNDRSPIVIVSPARGVRTGMPCGVDLLVQGRLELGVVGATRLEEARRRGTGRAPAAARRCGRRVGASRPPRRAASPRRTRAAGRRAPRRGRRRSARSRPPGS